MKMVGLGNTRISTDYVKKLSRRQLLRIRHSDNTTIITLLRDQPHLNSKREEQ